MLKLLYTLLLILCVSAFATSNECIRHGKTGHPDPAASVKTLTVDKPLATEKEDLQEYSTFQFVKYLYI
jgi:hypothetical protein